uniref:Uncharacterized protein n=1 Tax=Cucumis melo TaxID=3656 RepID=A0A9I9ELY6_CUCME
IIERRQAEAARIREKYLDRIPDIVEKAERSNISDIDKRNFDKVKATLKGSMKLKVIVPNTEKATVVSASIRHELSSIFFEREAEMQGMYAR